VRGFEPDDSVWEGREGCVVRALVVIQAIFDLFFDEEEGIMRSGMSRVVRSNTNMSNQLP
jgi:hypothetical protein